jgi:short-subunit dehydrogenase
MRLDGSTRALVTGASQGIGRALAEALAARGATVGLAARSADALRSLAATLDPAGVALPCDVGDAESVRAAVDAFGRLDLVVANAGIAHYEPVLAQDLSHVEAMTRVNWLGTVHTVTAAVPRLVEQGSGHVVIVSSGAALRAFPQAAAYGATKAAQRAFAGALRHELAGTGVGVTTVFPGEIATELHAHEAASMPEWYQGRRADPAALAQAVLAAVEADRRDVAFPREVRLLGLDGIAPGLVDRLLARLRGDSAAPRRDELAASRRSSAWTRRSAMAMNARVAGERCALRRVMNAKVSYSGGSNGAPVSRRE